MSDVYWSIDTSWINPSTVARARRSIQSVRRQQRLFGWVALGGLSVSFGRNSIIQLRVKRYHTFENTSSPYQEQSANYFAPANALFKTSASSATFSGGRVMEQVKVLL